MREGDEGIEKILDLAGEGPHRVSEPLLPGPPMIGKHGRVEAHPEEQPHEIDVALADVTEKAAHLAINQEEIEAAFWHRGNGEGAEQPVERVREQGGQTGIVALRA